MPTGVRFLTACLFAALSAAGPAQAQSDSPSPTKPAATILGASFSAVPDLLYDHLPDLPKGQGLVVDAVAKDTAAERIGLQRHDILLKYQATPVQTTKDLAQL